MKAQEETADRPAGPIKCPQCGTEYIIISYQPRILRVFDRIHGRLWLLGAAAAIGGIVFTASGVMLAVGGIYGSYAFRAFVGEQTFQLVFGEDPARWPAWAIFDLIAIPWTLYATGYKRSFLFNFTSILCAYPLSLALGHTDNAEIAWPPAPFASLAIFPFLFPIRNMIYSRLQAWVTKKAARPIEDILSHRSMRRIQFVEGVPGVIVDIIDARANAQPVAVNQPGQVEPANRVAAPLGNNLNRVLRGTGLGSNLIKPLFVPWIAKRMGSLLLTISDHWTPLKPVLGLRQSKFPKILYVGKPGLGLRTWSWNQLDPVWLVIAFVIMICPNHLAFRWRNSLGLMTFHVFYDGLQLWYTYLIERERQSRRVVSRSFEGIDQSSLDLINSV